MKKILLIYPLNFLKKDAGNNVYTYNIVKQLKEMGFDIDFFTFDCFGEDISSVIEQNKKEKLLNNIFIFRNKNEKKVYKKSIFKIKEQYGVRKYYLFGVQIFKKRLEPKLESVYNFVTKNMVDYCQEIIDKNKYDFVYIHYVWIADILNYLKISPNMQKIYSMHDADFLQRLQSGQNVGAFLDKEIKVLSLIDKFLCISFDEKIFFTKFFPDKKFVFLPPLLGGNKQSKERKKDIDALFIGHDNPYNKQALRWLIKKVLPLLDKNIKLTVCGKVLNGLYEQDPESYQELDKYNVNKIDFAEDLDDLLNRTKICLTPMFGGTGMKIKTVDAISRDIPVVSTIMGVDGFPDKTLSGILVTDDAKDFANNIEKLYYDEDFYNSVKNKIHDYREIYFNKLYTKRALEQIFEEKRDK